MSEKKAEKKGHDEEAPEGEGHEEGEGKPKRKMPPMIVLIGGGAFVGLLIIFAAVYFLFQMAHNVFPSIFVLFVGERFGWGPRDASFMLLATGSANIFVQATLVGPAVKRLGERGALLIGLASSAAGMMIYAFAPTGPIFYLGVVVGALSGLMSPGLQGLMTRRVGPSEQGQLQGANSAMMGVAAIAGPALTCLRKTVSINVTL